jgi:hypothetical protein
VLAAQHDGDRSAFQDLRNHHPDSLDEFLRSTAVLEGRSRLDACEAGFGLRGEIKEFDFGACLQQGLGATIGSLSPSAGSVVGDGEHHRSRRARGGFDAEERRLFDR